MPFRIRIRENSYLGDRQHELRARIVFAHLKIGQSELLKRQRSLWGHQVYVGALRLQDNSLLTIIAPSYSTSLINDYAQQWGIETLFGIFKSAGCSAAKSRLATLCANVIMRLAIDGAIAPWSPKGTLSRMALCLSVSVRCDLI